MRVPAYHLPGIARGVGGRGTRTERVRVVPDRVVSEGGTGKTDLADDQSIVVDAATPRVARAVVTPGMAVSVPPEYMNVSLFVSTVTCPALLPYAKRYPVFEAMLPSDPFDSMKVEGGPPRSLKVPPDESARWPTGNGGGPPEPTGWYWATPQTSPGRGQRRGLIIVDRAVPC